MLGNRATVAPKIAFASHQNAVPILIELALVSAHDEALDDLVVEATSDPGFLEPRTWRVDRLGPGGVAHVVDRDLKLSAALLARLDEAVAGALTLTVRRGEETLARRDFPVELLARSEWGGAASMAELLAAFVMPNDPAVDRVLKAASDVLRRAGKKDGIDGYEAKSRTRVWELASAIWSAVAALRLGYALPPASFERQGQKVRSPGAILDARLATCLDTALLFAAALEQAGLNPLVILTEGHALAGVWLQPREFASLVTDDAGTVRKRVDLKELVVFETTLATHSPPAGFQTAVDAGRRQIAEGADDAFVMALDLRRARMRRIRPLADPTSPSANVDGAAVEAAAESLEEAPALPGFDVEVAPEAPAGEADRIALWQAIDLRGDQPRPSLPPRLAIRSATSPRPRRRPRCSWPGHLRLTTSRRMVSPGRAVSSKSFLRSRPGAAIIRRPTSRPKASSHDHCRSAPLRRRQVRLTRGGAREALAPDPVRPGLA